MTAERLKSAIVCAKGFSLTPGEIKRWGIIEGVLQPCVGADTWVVESPKLCAGLCVLVTVWTPPPPHLKKSHLDHIAADAESRTWQLVRLRGSE